MKIESTVLRRIGSVPFWRGSVKCLPELERMYRKAAEYAIIRIENEGENIHRSGGNPSPFGQGG